jgi:acyl carrier protein phosphodiesterase
MNYLAHLFCSHDSPDALLGNFIADFVKGRVDNRFPAVICDGIRHHRRLDSFTDRHEVFLACRRLISACRRRYAGVIIDIAYDHFLALGWDRYSPTDLDAFVARVYERLRGHEAPIPLTARLVIEKMASEDWLRSYGTLEGVDQAFRRISRRLSRENNTLATAVQEVEANYAALHDHFHCFFPQLLAHARSCSSGAWVAGQAARPS